MRDRLASLIVALLFDALFRDPPNRYHPVAWMGRYIDWARERTPEGKGARFTWGIGLLLSGAGLSALAGWGIERAMDGRSRWLRAVVQGIVLKSTFSLSGLIRAALEVHAALRRGDLTEARRAVAWHLVSRPTADLSASQVAAATIESIAENTSDGVIAPLFYYALGGLPAALAYRFVNTADAMLGYRDVEREWLGKGPARADDVLNLLPARLTALALVIAAWLQGEDVCAAWRIWRRDGGKTASPNAGHPMSAMAGALGIELEKTGHYRLGRGARPPGVEDIERAIALTRAAVFIVLLSGMLEFVRSVAAFLPYLKSSRIHKRYKSERADP